MKSKLLKNNNRLFIITELILICILLLLTFGDAYGWLTKDARKIGTMAGVKTPAKLSILGEDQSELEYISFNNIDFGNSDNSAYFLFCIYALDPPTGYDVELAYTTNNNFTYSLYRAKKCNAPTEAYLNLFQGEYGSYYYMNNSCLQNEVIHQVMGEEESAVFQDNAVPSFLLATIDSPCNSLGGSGAFAEYFVLKVTWEAGEIASMDKEVDMIYIITEESV